MDAITVRRATPADAPMISPMISASYAQLMAGSYDRLVLNAAVEKMGRANPTLLASEKYYVAMEQHGSIVGGGGWSFEMPGTSAVIDGEAHLRHFAVHPDWAGKGVGGAIFDVCKEAVIANGVSKLVVDASLNAEAFYISLGFSGPTPIEVSLGNGISFPCVRMSMAM